MSEYKKQAELIASGFLQQIGEKYDVVELGDYPITEQLLITYGKAFNDAVAKELDKSGSVASGKIGDLVVPQIKKFGNDYEMYLGYDAQNPAHIYYKFVNKGVRGYADVPKKKKKINSDTPYFFKSPFPNEKMIQGIEGWLKLGKAKFSGDTQKKKLSKTQRKYKKLSKLVTTNDLRTLATNISFAIKRDGLKSTNYFDNAIKKVFDKGFFDTMAKAIGGDVRLQIRQIGNKLENNGYNNK